MKYENVEFERNFQLKPTDKPTDAASSSVCTQSQSEKSHDDIQVLLRTISGMFNVLWKKN